jgi:hypothetical protein
MYVYSAFSTGTKSYMTKFEEKQFLADFVSVLEAE